MHVYCLVVMVVLREITKPLLITEHAFHLGHSLLRVFLKGHFIISKNCG